jgi:hypothetical protein
MSLGNSHSIASSDYNGYRPNKGVRDQYKWFAPPPGEINYSPGRGDWKTFSTLADLQAGTDQEAHSIEVDYDDFEQLNPPDVANPYAVYHAMDIKLDLKPDSKAVDAGVIIPTVNDNYEGKAPDLGAHEVGAPKIKYGPRWLTWEPFYR